MAKHPIVIQNARRLGRRHLDTTLLQAAQACANCALKDGAACADCIAHALNGHGFVYRTPIVRH